MSNMITTTVRILMTLTGGDKVHIAATAELDKMPTYYFAGEEITLDNFTAKSAQFAHNLFRYHETINALNNSHKGYAASKGRINKAAIWAFQAGDRNLARKLKNIAESIGQNGGVPQAGTLIDLQG